MMLELTFEIILIQHLHFTYGESETQRGRVIYPESLKLSVRNIFHIDPLKPSFV